MRAFRRGNLGQTLQEPESFNLETYTVGLEDIGNIEIDDLQSLSVGVRWPHRANDWEMLRKVGHGIAAVDRIGRVLGSAMWFDSEPSFATVGMVITTPRLQVHGAATWLMKHVLDELGDRRVGLNATRAATRLYRSLGFDEECPVFQHQARIELPAQAPSPEGVLIEQMQSRHLEAIFDLDRRAYGADRSRILHALAPMSDITVLLRGGDVHAYAFCRPSGRGSVIGPVIAFTDDDAASVVHPHVLTRVGQFVRLDTRAESGHFPQYLASCGLPVADSVMTMSCRGRWITYEKDRPTMFGLASQALG